VVELATKPASVRRGGTRERRPTPSPARRYS
jgi:hypothetical protein